ncbi:uroporphyrinogen decarboxylase family protein [Chloroflexota bacterium]
MSMTPRERILAVLNGEEPDKIPVACLGSMPGFEFCPEIALERLKKRGLSILRMSSIYTPVWSVLSGRDPGLPDVKYTGTEYVENGILKQRQTYKTPAGNITCVIIANPIDNVALSRTPQEYLVKQPSDWRVVNYITRAILDNLAPMYQHFQREEEGLGDEGIAYIILGITAWQNAWITLAGPERAIIDFHQQPDEVQEYIDLDRRWHTRLAEFAADCPAKYLVIQENMSDMTSPRYYREYCLPIYEIYAKHLHGTGKVLGAHMDGPLGKLKKEIAESPINVIDSLSVPPTGDVSLTEVREIWPDKMVFMNTAAHLSWAEPAKVREFYKALAEEWGSKKGLLLELCEHLPLETVEAHMSAALDAFGY